MGEVLEDTEKCFLENKVPSLLQVPGHEVCSHLGEALRLLDMRGNTKL